MDIANWKLLLSFRGEVFEVYITSDMDCKENPNFVGSTKSYLPHFMIQVFNLISWIQFGEIQSSISNTYEFLNSIDLSETKN